MKNQNDINIKFWNSNLFKGLKISETQYSVFEFPKHFHNYYTFMFIKHGANEGFTNKSSYTFGNESLLIINPGDVHAGKSFQKDLLNFYSFRVEQDFLKNLLNKNMFDFNCDLIFSTKPIPIKKYLNNIFLLIENIKSNSASLELESLLINLFFELINDQNICGKKITLEKIDSDYLLKAKNYIEENYFTSFDLDNLSRHCGISSFYLIRQFKNKFGLTPFEYLRNYRIEKAKKLIQNNISITEAAHSVGFYDHSHFLRNFKKLNGMLPSQYQIS